MVADRDLEAHFRHEGDVVFRAAIDFGVPLLPAIAIGLADRHSLDAQPIERRSHLVQFERLDDRQDELHDRTPSKGKSPGSLAMPAKSPTQARIYTRGECFAVERRPRMAGRRGRFTRLRLQARPGEIESRQSPVPPLAGRVVISGIGVLVKLGAHIGRRLVGKRIPFQEPGHRRFVFQEALEKARKPRHSLRVVKRGEPHLPVEPRLMRDVPWRTALDIAGLVAEFVLAPLLAVIGPLDDDFIAGRGHDRKQAVRAHDMERLEEVIDRQRRPRRAAAESLVHLDEA